MTVPRPILLLLTLLLGTQTLLFSTPAAAAAKTCELEISGNDMLQFDKKELAAAVDCTEVELTLKHTGKLPANPWATTGRWFELRTLQRSRWSR